ncbi:hypothetical protein BDY17DRAFT_311612 [Neohortaea acidophila]|uniref:Uncharacterized protein n=1 Tax=Neohortaea acidophila TaxID=245834 RepID=A0A6A6PRD1_9PEZI|nr:uncharacterized protein BDY17DRAFT_311612 [Neohortaea acidophila]KAF2482013.1 hypothetical protein BDY17DRAFT_311612 [Neohortaea acidophila]
MAAFAWQNLLVKDGQRRREEAERKLEEAERELVEARRQAPRADEEKTLSRELGAIKKQLKDAQEQVVQLTADRANDRRLVACFHDLLEIVSSTDEAVSILKKRADYSEGEAVANKLWDEIRTKQAHTHDT